MNAFHLYWFQQLESANVTFASNTKFLGQDQNKRNELEKQLSQSYSLTPVKFERLYSPSVSNDNDSNRLISHEDKEKLERKKAKKEKKGPSIVTAIIQAFGLPFLLAGPMKIIYDITQFAGPVFLEIFLTYAENFKTSEHAQKQGILIVYFIILAQFVYPCTKYCWFVLLQ